MLPKIVITHKVHDEILTKLAPYARVSVNESDDTWAHDRLLAELSDATAMMAFMPDRIDATVLSHAPSLRLVACALKGFDNFDVAACTARGVHVSIVSDLLTDPTAELTIGLMIGLGRHILPGDEAVRIGYKGWRPRFYGVGLKGAAVGILGMGAIGKSIAERLTGFGTQASYWDRRELGSDDEERLKVTFTDFERLLSTSDFVVCALPLANDTQHLLGALEVAKMRKGTLLINPSRGSVVDEGAVVAALEAGHLAGYAADVYEMEDWARPDRPEAVHPGLVQRRTDTLLTPHIGSAVTKTRLAIEHEAADNIIDLLEGRRPRAAINEPAAVL